MTKTVFLVTSGSYSDYGVEAVFSTLELASAAVEGRTDDVRIEPYSLDDPNGEPEGVLPFKVRMWLDGTQDSAPYRSDIHPRSSRETTARVLRWNDGNDPRWPDQLAVECWARDAEHATKIANEIRTAYNAGSLPLPHDYYRDGNWRSSAPSLRGQLAPA